MIHTSHASLCCVLQFYTSIFLYWRQITLVSLVLDASLFFFKCLRGLCKSQFYQAAFSGLELQIKVGIGLSKSVEESTFKLCICSGTGV